MRKRGNRIHNTRRDATAFVRLFENRSLIPESHARKVGLAYHLALEEMRRGRGTDAAMNQLAYALNLALVLCELGFGPEQEARIHRAQEFLEHAVVGGRQGRRWHVSEEAYRAICPALEVHDQQIETATHADIRRAEEKIKERLAAGDVVRLEVVNAY